ncbi:MAG: LacI family DNA-binding transcriptional regulator [Anaerolineae bacterium]|nr:LacI family DNA-binding transcriptional regulator [Anaerolineae bacterium]
MNLEDIAKKAGVSRSTVSRVINNERYVSQSVRQRVLDVIEREQFQPNPAARALVTRRSNIIGVSIPQTMNVFFGDNSYFPMLLQGIAEAVNRLDYAMLLWLAESHEVRDTFARRVIRHRQPDGLLLTSVTDDDPLFDHLLQRNRHFVMVESPPRQEDKVSYVTVDNVHAAETAVNHLVEIGRRRIATITGQINIRDASERLAGYTNALQAAGLPVDENLIAYGRFDREHGYSAMRELLQHQPDAVFAGGDTAAIGAIAALKEAGLRVPEDVAVIGFDDLDVAVQANLTTIRHSVQTVGSTAARLLIDIIEGRLEHPHHIVLPTELVIRGSTVRV